MRSVFPILSGDVFCRHTFVLILQLLCSQVRGPSFPVATSLLSHPSCFSLTPRAPRLPQAGVEAAGQPVPCPGRWPRSSFPRFIVLNARL
jgi:hypothetical protein